MRIFPKINIFLNVLFPNPDGMHPILSRVVLAKGDLYDEMEVSFGRDCFGISGDFAFGMEENLIFLAKEKLKEFFPFLTKDLESIKVEVKKSIPQGAGLGGGSANAGAFLLCVGERFEIPRDKLAQVASSIGSDVSFFVHGYAGAHVSGVGEVVEEFIEENRYEIFTPSFGCETRAVYQAFDRFSSSSLKRDFKDLSSIQLLTRYSREELNDLYLPATRIYPSLVEIAEELGDQWFFSGSGSSFFRILN